MIANLEMEDKISNGRNFIRVKRIPSLAVLILDIILITHPWNGGTPILKNRANTNISYNKEGKTIKLINTISAGGVWDRKYFTPPST